MSRPRNSETGESRTKRISVYVTDSEHEKIEKLAPKGKLSDWGRDLMLAATRGQWPDFGGAYEISALLFMGLPHTGSWQENLDRARELPVTRGFLDYFECNQHDFIFQFGGGNWSEFDIFDGSLLIMRGVHELGHPGPRDITLVEVRTADGPGLYLGNIVYGRTSVLFREQGRVTEFKYYDPRISLKAVVHAILTPQKARHQYWKERQLDFEALKSQSRESLALEPEQ